MGYERYPRGTQPGDYYNNQGMDYGRDYGSGRDYTYSSARDYEAAGESGGGSPRRYGSQEYGNQRYGQREQQDRGGRDYYGGRGYDSDRGSRDDVWREDYRQRGNAPQNHGSYGSDGRRFEDVGRYRTADDDRYNDPDQRYETRGRSGGGERNYGRQPQGYDYQERGFMARAGDEVRSWFGDDDAERRREMDSRYDERRYGGRGNDEDYHSWRSGQIAAFDRDYDEYRRENRSKFENDFSSWRNTRQTQRDSLDKVTEHMDVVGSDGAHVGTVDKVRGDRILLTKNDADADGRHHSIPSSWMTTVDDKVTLSKTADEAKRAWKDEESSQAMFGYGDRTRDDDEANRGRTLNRSFSGTY